MGFYLLLIGLSFRLMKKGSLYYQNLTENGMMEWVRDEKINPSLAERVRQMTVRIVFALLPSSGHPHPDGMQKPRFSHTLQPQKMHPPQPLTRHHRHPIGSNSTGKHHCFPGKRG